MPGAATRQMTPRAARAWTSRTDLPARVPVPISVPGLPRTRHVHAYGKMAESLSAWVHMQSGCNFTRFGRTFTPLLAILLSLSVLGLFAGAALVALGRLRLGATSALEGLALGMLPALVLLRLLPHAYESLGLGALALAAAGFAAVGLSHRAGERVEARLGGALVLPALILHAITDGAALAISSTGRVGDSAWLLALAAILHRIPEGFFVASRRQAHGSRAALLAAAPLALATVAGAILGERIFEVLPDSALDAVLAVGAGAMLRLFLHTHDAAPVPPPAARAIAATALLCGVVIVVAVPGPDDVLQSAQPREFSVASSILPLFIESSPALLLGLLLSSLLRAHAQHLPLGAASALRGWLWGARQQLRPSELGRLPLASAAPALVVGVCVATAQLGAETLGLSLAWLGLRVTLVRVLGSVVLAWALAAIVITLRREPPVGSSPAAPHAKKPSPRYVWELFQQALDESAAWMLLSLLLSAALEAALTPALLRQLPAPWDSLLAGAIALLGRASALTVTPVVAVLLHKGLGLGAGLTLLWLSPLAGIPLTLWLGRKPGLAGALTASLTAGALSIALGEVVERVLTKHGVPELHPLVTHDCSTWEYACAVVLALLVVRSLFRLGPRGFASSRPPERTLCAVQH
jgi:uncharacterized protein